MLTAPTLPVDRPTAVACPRCHGSGRDWRDRVCGDCKGAGIAACALCKARSVKTVATASDGLACRDCIKRRAWACAQCKSDGEPKIVADDDGDPVLLCGAPGCGGEVETVACCECEKRIGHGDVAHGDGVRCRDCAEDTSCRSCDGSGGGDHPGIRCNACGGSGETKRRRWRSEYDEV